MLEKKQKLFLKEADPDSGFQELSPEEGAQKEVETFSGPQTPSINKAFVLPGSFWKWFEEDEALKAELEQQIEERVSKRVDQMSESIKTLAAKEGFEEGYAKGMEEGKLTVKSVVDDLNEISKKICNEKSQLLREHEKEWAESLGYLLKRFMVREPELSVHRIQEWAEVGLASFEEKGKITVRMSSADFKKIENSISSDLKHWEFLEDSVLEDGQLRCDCDSGGFFFSPSDQWKKLEEWIERYCGKK